MFKKEIKPLSEGMADSITKSINKLQHIEEKASRSADHAEGDVKPADISGEEEVKADGSAKKAPARKGDKAVAEAYMDEKSCVGEMKKLHASSCSKTEMYKKVSEKYGCSEEKFEELYAQYCNETYEEVQEDNSNDKSDDGEGMDKVQPKAVKKKFDDRKDKDIDNDGDEDDSDEYLHKRRKAISKALESKKLNASVDESAELEGLDEGFSPKDIKMAIGIASDKRYKGGNMTGAVKAINKLKKGLSDHPQVSAVLKRQNEEVKEEKNCGCGKTPCETYGEVQEARPPKIQKGKAKGTISATGMRGKGNKKFDVMVAFDNGKFSFRITDESGRFQTVGIKQASKMLGEESVADLTEAKLNEAKNSDYTIYHKTFSSAVQHAIAVAKKRGYAVDEDDWDRKVAMGPRKPSKGKTNSYSINLSKNGKDVRQKLQMQVYYDQGRYELNMYIS